MSKAFKCRYIVILLVAVSLICSAAAFSVSYASWINTPYPSEIRAGGVTWSGGSGSDLDFTDPTGVSYIGSDGAVHKIVPPKDADNDDLLYDMQGIIQNGGYAIFYVKPSARNQRFRLCLKDINIAHWGFAESNTCTSVMIDGDDLIINIGDENSAGVQYYQFLISSEPGGSDGFIIVNEVKYEFVSQKRCFELI